MKAIILSIFIFSVLGCSKNDDSGNDPQAITPLQISQFHLTGTEGVPQQNIVIADEAVWETIKESMSTRLHHFTETEINFDEFIVLAVFDQIYPYEGNSIDITGVVEHQSNIIVTVDRLLPGSALTMIQQPYHIVKIPISNKPVVFEMAFE